MGVLLVTKGVLIAMAIAAVDVAQSLSPAASPCSRRSFGRIAAAAAAVTTTTTFVALPQISNAMPMVTPDEFNIILRDSARSIDRVEFSGPKSETIVVQLADGTSFGLKDVIESSTDPRSPLKIAAACNANKVPTRFTDLEAVLAATPRKTKTYANERVLQAAERNKEKALRIAQDEEFRQAELARMQE